MPDSDPDPLAASLPLFKGLASWQSTPFTTKVGKSIWTVATDGAYLIAVQGKIKGYAARSPDERVGKFVASPVVKPAHGVELGKLKAWAGPVPADRLFKEPENNAGVLFDVTVDRRRLACLLESLPFGMIQVWNATTTIEMSGLGLGAKGFRAILAGLDTDPDPEDPAFLFRPPSELEIAMQLLSD